MTQKDLLTLKEKVLQKRPILEEVLERFGNLSLYEYALLLSKQTNTAVPETRKNELIQIIGEEIERLLGKDIADSCIEQLKNSYIVSTTEHTGLLSDPGMVSVSILRSLPYFQGLREAKNIISLTCSNISFDNFSFPRGLLFHAEMSDQISSEQLTFFGRSVDSQPILFHQGYTMEAFALIRKRIITMINERRVVKNVGERINSLLEELYKSDRVLQQSTYEDQVTILNYEHWKLCFAIEKESTNIIHLPQEKITLELLKRYHLHQKTVIHKLLFNEKYRELLLQYSSGIPGAFSEKKNYGTFLFWALPVGAKYRIQLWQEGNYLLSRDGVYKLELSPESIANAIAKNELIPSLMLTFFTISFFHGMQVIGGTGQSTYLTQMRHAYQQIMKVTNESNELQLSESIETLNTAYVHPLITFMKSQNSARIPATGTDLFLYQNSEMVGLMLKASRRISIEDAFSRSFPYLYKMFYKGDERNEQLAAITEDQIEKLLGLDKKIHPISSLHP